MARFARLRGRRSRTTRSRRNRRAYLEDQGGCADADYVRAANGTADSISAALASCARNRSSKRWRHRHRPFRRRLRRTGARRAHYRRLTQIVAFAPGGAATPTTSRTMSARRIVLLPLLNSSVAMRACRSVACRAETTLTLLRNCRSAWRMRFAQAAAAWISACCLRPAMRGTMLRERGAGDGFDFLATAIK